MRWFRAHRQSACKLVEGYGGKSNCEDELDAGEGEEAEAQDEAEAEENARLTPAANEEKKSLIRSTSLTS